MSLDRVVSIFFAGVFIMLVLHDPQKIVGLCQVFIDAMWRVMLAIDHLKLPISTTGPSATK